MSWLYIPAIIIAFLVLTRAPELRVQRLRLGVSLFLLLGVAGLFFLTSNPWLLFFGLLVLRLGAFLFGMVWFEVFGYHAAATYNGILYGNHEFEADQPVITNTVAHHWRATGRPALALLSLRHTLAKRPHDFHCLLLMATIQAEDCHDLAAARATIQRITQSMDIPFGQQDYAMAQFEHWRKQFNSSIAPLPPMKSSPGAIGTQLPTDQARRHCLEGNPNEARKILEQEHKAKPENYDVLLALATVYAEELNDLPKAEQTIKKLLKLGYLPGGWKEMVQNRLNDWQEQAEPRPPKLTAQLMVTEAVPQLTGIDAAREHRSAGRRGSAIECLEKWLQANPGDFEAAMLMTEIHAEDNADVRAAEKLVRRITVHPAFSPQQKEHAENRLKAWKVAERDKPNGSW